MIIWKRRVAADNAGRRAASQCVTNPCSHSTSFAPLDRNCEVAEYTARMPPLSWQWYQLKHSHTIHHCHCEERSDVAIRPFGVTDVDLQRLKGERIATPVCGLVRNDSIG